MDAKRTVSVIVPVYNAEAFLSKCIESLVGQTYPELEIIIVNDGSTDHSLKICEDYANKYCFIKIINKRNEGVSLARLAGVRMAAGQYISFVDADDWIERNYIERMMDELHDSDIILAGISRILVSENNRIVKEKNNMAAGIYKSEEELQLLFGKMLCYDVPFKPGVLPYACNKIYKKEMLIPWLEKIDKRINDGEDVAVIFPYLIHSKKIVLSDYCGYQYRIHQNSVCNKKREDAYRNASCLYLWLYDIFSASKHAGILLPQLRAYYLRMIWKRDPGIYMETNEFVFPFNKINKNSKIIIYGAGDVGRTYYIQAEQSGYCTVVAWADKNLEHPEGLDYALIKPEEIQREEFDYVIVSIRSEYICNQVHNYLVEMGIGQDKIILCDAGVEKVEDP